MNKTLVIGGSGYIGSHMKKVFPDFIYSGRAEFDLKEILTIQNFFEKRDIDTCIILSATISYDKNVNFLDEPFSTNLIGLNNLLSVLKNINENIKVIYFSSMTVYAENNISPVLESSELAPLHSYGLSKVYAENLVKYYGFPAVIIRIPGIYGGNRKSGLIYNVIQKMKLNEDVSIDTYNLGYWETLHIDDMLDMFSKFIAVYSFKQKFNIFNIAYGEKTDFIETIYYISDVLKSESKIIVSKEYKDLYLSNEKILKFIELPIKYKLRLKKYIGEII
jgi:nucleoside-diphosphate-sugar epimerase